MMIGQPQGVAPTWTAGYGSLGIGWASRVFRLTSRVSPEGVERLGLTAMNAFEFFVLYRLPYLACPFYLIMLGVRIWVWTRFYNPALKLLPDARGPVYRVWKRQYRPTIHIFPGRPRARGLEWKRAIMGFVFFSGLYKRDKVLWLGSWSLHLGLFLVIIAHARAILSPNLDRLFLYVALAGSGLMTTSGVYLLLRRVIVPRVREITDFRDYLAECILLCFSATAFLLMLDGGVTSETLRRYVSALLTGTSTVLDVKRMFVWHMLSAHLLLIVIPFSHLLHSGGIFLSREFLGTSDTYAGEFGSGLKDSQDKPISRC